MSFEQGNQLLYFACRHHIFELVIEAVFSVQMKPSGSPDILLFERFLKSSFLTIYHEKTTENCFLKDYHPLSG